MITLPRIAALAALILVPTLAGCAQSTASGVNEIVDGCPQVDSGSASDSIKPEGEFGGKVTIELGEPVSVDGAQRTIITEGTGVVPKAGATVRVLENIFSGETGDIVGAQIFELPISDDTLSFGVRVGIDCLPIGTRSVTVVPATDLYPADSLASLGLSNDESVILVTDIIEEVVEPVPVAWTENVATVTWSGDQPTISLPDAGAPAELSLAVLKEGTGDVIGGADTVKVNYMGVSWTTGEVFDQSYDGEAVPLSMTGVIKGFRAALLGQKVGAQLLVSIPAAQAYGTDPNAHKLGGQDLLFLIDAIELVTE